MRGIRKCLFYKGEYRVPRIPRMVLGYTRNVEKVGFISAAVPCGAGGAAGVAKIWTLRKDHISSAVFRAPLSFPIARLPYRRLMIQRIKNVPLSKSRPNFEPLDPDPE